MGQVLYLSHRTISKEQVDGMDMSHVMYVVAPFLEKVLEGAFQKQYDIKYFYGPLLAVLENQAFNECVNLQWLEADNLQVLGDKLFDNCLNLRKLKTLRT